MQGGSTITQQVAKNLVVGDDVTYERKMREMIVASRLESLLSKDDILELYLNTIYLGRGAWGIELAARSFFGKPAKDLTLAQGAMLAGLAIYLPRWRRNRDAADSTPAADGPPLTDADSQRLAEDLARYDV